MADTSISDIAGRIIVNVPRSRSSTGSAATDVYPGQCVILDDTTLKWTLADADTAAHKLKRGGIVTWKSQIDDDGSFPDIDDLIDIDNRPMKARIKVCTFGMCACKVDDQGGQKAAGYEMIISSTAGNLTIRAQEATGATSGTAFKSACMGVLASTLTNGDTVGFVDLNNWEMKN